MTTPREITKEINSSLANAIRLLDYHEPSDKKEMLEMIKYVKSANARAQQLENLLLGIKDPNQKTQP